MADLSFTAGRKFDVSVAALAAVSAGFVTFAMPEELFAGLVLATPLPDLVAAARPPLGDTARIAALAAAAAAAFAGVFFLLRLLDRIPGHRSAAAVAAAGAPRIRKADAHPDAPVRQPLLAGRDLGEPLELEPAAAAPAEEPIQEAPPLAPQARPLPSFLVAGEPSRETSLEAALPQDSGSLAALCDRLPPASPNGGASLGDMVNRIEAGIGRKRQVLSRESVEPAPPGAAAADGGQVRHRLRSAISELQKISATGA